MALTDAELRQKQMNLKKDYPGGKPCMISCQEAFAAVRGGEPRVIIAPNPDSPNRTMRHFDVQLIGGVVLHQGKIAEMATGEGKPW